jgi:hypothetical protein
MHGYRPPPGAWAAQPGPQTDAIILRAVPELLFGGAKGGGKTDFLLGDFAQDAGQGRAWRGVIFRRSYPELEEVIARSQMLIPATWPGSEWAKMEKTWYLSTGATLRMRSLEQPEDVSKYWGHEYAYIGWDELGAFPDDHAYRMMFACLRSAEPVECKRVRATANPGGAGHFWLKTRFIDPNPLGYELITDPDTGMERVYIPSRVQNNRILMARDPGYVDRLRGIGSPELVRSWLDGDWSSIVGGYFPEFGQQHIVRPLPVPQAWLRFRAFDWGSARPFAVLWLAAVGEGGGIHLPRGALLVYREWYGASSPGVGLRMTAEQVADGIKARQPGDEEIAYSVADPAIFASDGGPSIGERMASRRVYFTPADNTRVGKLGAGPAGWDLVRQRLIGEDDRPMLYVFSSCVNLIRSLPALQHDPRRPEDLDSSGDDHLADSLRYAVASRPWVRVEQEAKTTLNLNLLWEERERARRW